MRGGETFALPFDAPANTSGTKTVFTLPEGSAFQCEQADILIEGAAPLSVTVAVLNGQARLAPANGSVGGGGQLFELRADTTISPGNEITAKFDNPDSEGYAVIVLLHGQYVEDQ
jgi:hypothetical protein